MNFSKDKHIIIPICLVFAAVVAFRSWKDMHPPPKPPDALFDAYYMVKDDKALAPFLTDPDDQRPIVVWAGDIKTGKDGALSLTSTPVKPVSLPQREIILAYTLDTVPALTGPLAKIVSDASEKWSDLGDLINDVYLHGPKDEASAEKMLEAATPLRDKLHEGYWLGLYLDGKTLEAIPDAKAKLEDADKSVRTIILNAKDAMKPGEKLADLIKNLDKNAVLPYLLEMDNKPDYAALQKDLHPDPERLVGFLIDAPPEADPNKY